MKRIRVAIVGYGNIGRFALEALKAAPDMECAGIVRRNPSKEGFSELESLKVVSDVRDLGQVDVAILAVPSRKVEETALHYLGLGISTVDSFDIHTGIVDLRRSLSAAAVSGGAASVISAGWDPGSDSVVRALLQAIAPNDGVTYTNFGPGRSMGHTVAAKAIPGVRNALSMTLPAGKGIHNRHVYIELEEGYDFESVSDAIKTDPYFAFDRTEVELVESVAALDTLMHGVNLVREGSAGMTPGQQLEFNMRVNNPALTGQVLVCAARAATRREPGCYTMVEIPVIDLLPGDPEENIRHLV